MSTSASSGDVHVSVDKAVAASATPSTTTKDVRVGIMTWNMGNALPQARPLRDAQCKMMPRAGTCTRTRVAFCACLFWLVLTLT